MAKRIVIWGTGFVGKMVIPEVLRHPDFELVGVGVINPAKVGVDVGEICGLPRTDRRAGHRRRRRADRAQSRMRWCTTDRPPHTPTPNIDLIGRFLRAGVDVCSTAMTPWVWPKMHLNPPNWIEPITEACEAGGRRASPPASTLVSPTTCSLMTLMGLCSRYAGCASELLDYTNYEGDYEFEMGIGREPEYQPLLENLRHPGVRVGRDGADDRPRRGHQARRDHHHLGQVGDTRRTHHRQGRHPGRACGAVRFTINGVYRGETRIQLEHVNRIGHDAALTGVGQPGRRLPGRDRGHPSIFQETAFRFTDGSGRDAAAAGCLATGLRALNAVPAVNDLPPGWVTPLDLPLIPGHGTIR